MYNRLKKLRKYNKMTQYFVAEKMNMNQATIVAIEHNQRKVTTEELKKFSELYGVSLDEIVYGKQPDNSDEKDIVISTLVKKFKRLSIESQNEVMNFIDFKQYCEFNED